MIAINIVELQDEEKVNLVGIATLLLLGMAKGKSIKKSGIVFLASALDVSLNGAEGNLNDWLRQYESR